MSTKSEELPDLAERPSSPALSSSSPTRALGFAPRPAAPFNPFQPLLPSVSTRRPLVRKPLSALTEEQRRNLKRTQRPPLDELVDEDASSVICPTEGASNAARTEFSVTQRTSVSKVQVKKRKPEAAAHGQSEAIVTETHEDLAKLEINDDAQASADIAGSSVDTEKVSAAAAEAVHEPKQEADSASRTTTQQQEYSSGWYSRSGQLGDGQAAAWDSGGVARDSTTWEHQTQTAHQQASEFDTWGRKPHATHSSGTDWICSVPMSRHLHQPQRSHNHRLPHESAHLELPTDFFEPYDIQHWLRTDSQALTAPAESSSAPKVLRPSTTKFVNLAAATAWDELLPPSKPTPMGDALTAPFVPSFKLNTTQEGVSLDKSSPATASPPSSSVAEPRKAFSLFKKRKVFISVPNELWPAPLNRKRQPLRKADRPDMRKDETDSLLAPLETTSRACHPAELPPQTKPAWIDVCTGVPEGWQDVWADLFAKLLRSVDAGSPAVQHVKKHKPVVLKSQVVSTSLPSQKASVVTTSSPNSVIALSQSGARGFEAPMRDDESFLHAPTPLRPGATGGWMLPASPQELESKSWSSQHQERNSVSAMERNFGWRDMTEAGLRSASPPDVHALRLQALNDEAQDWSPDRKHPHLPDKGFRLQQRLHGPRPLEPASLYDNSDTRLARVLRATNPDPVPFSPAQPSPQPSSQLRGFAQFESPSFPPLSSIGQKESEQGRRPLPPVPSHQKPRFASSTPPDGQVFSEPHPFDVRVSAIEQEATDLSIEDVSTSSRRRVRTQSPLTTVLDLLDGEFDVIRQELERSASVSREVAEEIREVVEQAVGKLAEASRESSREQASLMLDSRVIDQSVVEGIVGKSLLNLEQQLIAAIEATARMQMQQLQSNLDGSTALRTELEAAIARVEVYRASEIDLLSRLSESQTRATALERDLHHATREVTWIRLDRDRLRSQLEALTGDYKTNCMEFKALQVDNLSAERVLALEKEAHAATRGQVLVLEQRISDLDSRLEKAMRDQALTERPALKDSIDSSSTITSSSSEIEMKGRNDSGSVADLDEVETAQECKSPLIEHFVLSPTPSTKNLREDEQGWWSEYETEHELELVSLSHL
ncbi:hypothetical protein ACM66B_004669 [Microbotryomycetes sp. NB124-2]